MKKRILVLLIVTVCALMLASCGCEHEWVDATCDTPKTCSLCEMTEGEALGHTWQDADCVTPKTCTVCGETEGESLGHSWEEATCKTPKTCTLCVQTEGAPLDHSFGDYTCDGTNFLSNCALCGLEQVLDPETYARQILIGTWDADFYENLPIFTENPGHTITFYADGTGTLELDKRLWYPKTVQLRFEEFAYQDVLGSYSMDFYLDDYMLDEWDADDYDMISEMGYGISIRLHTPDSSQDWDIHIAMSYSGYGAVWTFRKRPAA